MTSGKTLFASSLTVLLLAFSAPVVSDNIKRIVHPDGTVEYTNVKDSGQKRASSKDEVVYRYRDDNGVVAYSGVQPASTDFDVIRFHCYACNPDSNVNWRTTPLFLKPYQDEIRTAASEFNVDPALVRAVIHAESAFNDKALSPKGAQGLMQLMPATAQELGVRNAMVAPENIRGGVNYLARMLKRFDGDIKLATAAYNAGPGAVGRHGGIPPYAETRAYVERVGILHERYASN
ncbi:lytic transglycosylase domain-containing protein [Marinobacter sp. TBZ242]|uniref:Lytic transglycosylase domain-containing protein n=1 Tax=Marinobacter azerbaijanicus TaxID=3050455 RepID=A0ABT7IDM5_9GAMM|nr:lytic transglycosylase domain-containing protein [Marinobacter sp. TBZ242]MDL0432250.1 lytic transglycosylase domain-containing protein [Marinobacter sp. TBZ242]